jgi:hypothetical protein
VTVEVAAACGLTYAQIGGAIDRRACQVGYHLTGHLRQPLPPRGREWTKEERIIAEVAAACGISLGAIGRLLQCSGKAAKMRLCAAAKEKEREVCRARYQLNREKKLEQCREYRRRNPVKCREASRRRYIKAGPERHRQRCRRWAEANHDKTLEYSRRYRKANPEKVRESARRYCAANREKEQIRRRRYRQRYPDRVRQTERNYRKANFEKVKENARAWRAMNRDKVCEISRRRQSIKRAARRRALLPASRVIIDSRFDIWSNLCAFCGSDANHSRNHGYDRLAVEHVLALTKGGLDEASNIVPACFSCNSSKHARPVETWYRAQPFFTEARWRKIQRHCPAAVVGQLPLALPV